MKSPPYKVLILCTGNSARSILGEFLLKKMGGSRFEAYSAGAHPSGVVHPLALWVLREKYGIDAAQARSKSWDEFKDVPFDFVITVCDNAREACPVWPGLPVLAHWGSPDPAAHAGSDEENRQFFVQVADQIARRVEFLCQLSDQQLDKAELHRIAERTALNS